MDLLIAILALLVVIAILFDVARRIGIPYPTLSCDRRARPGGGAGTSAHQPGAGPRAPRLPAAAPVRGRRRVANSRSARRTWRRCSGCRSGWWSSRCVIVALIAHAVDSGSRLGRRVHARGDRGASDALAATVGVSANGRAARRADARRGRGALQRRHGARRVSRQRWPRSSPAAFVLVERARRFRRRRGRRDRHRLRGRAALRLRTPAPPGQPARRGRDLDRASRSPPSFQRGARDAPGCSPRSPRVWSSARRFGKVLTPSSRVLWLLSWKMIGFMLNGFVFVLIGLALPISCGNLGWPDAARDRSASGCWSAAS